MNPRFDTTMRTAFGAAVRRFADLPLLHTDPARVRLAMEVSHSFDRGVGAPRPRRAH